MRLALGAILQPALVAAQPLLDLQQSLVGAGISVGGIGFGFQRDPGIEVQRAVGTEAETVLAERDMAGIVAVEIFAQDFFGAFADAPAQRFADIDAFARDSYGHVMPRLRRGSRDQYPDWRKPIKPVRCRGSGPRVWLAPKVHCRAYSVCRGGAAPRMECASPRGISPRCGGQYQCRPRAIVPQSCRPTGSRSRFPRRSTA